MRLHNRMTFQEIATHFKVAKSSVQEALGRFTACIPDPAVREAYAQSKADVLEGVQFEMIASLTDPAKIQKATLGNMAYAASKLDEMIRLERGQSTRNVSVLSAMLDAAHGSLFQSGTGSDPALPRRRSVSCSPVGSERLAESPAAESDG